MADKETTAWEKWKDIAARAATFQARVLLVMFYWVCVTPFAIVVRLISDPLALSAEDGGSWQRHPESELGQQH